MKPSAKNALLIVVAIAITMFVVKGLCSVDPQRPWAWTRLYLSAPGEIEAIKENRLLQEQLNSLAEERDRRLDHTTDVQQEVRRLREELEETNNKLADQMWIALSTPEWVPIEKELTLPEVVENVIGGVVNISMGPNGQAGQASGFVIGPHLILTAQHCVEDIESFDITTHEGHRLHATRAISSKNHDIAFIYIDDLTCVAEKERELECKKVRHKVVLKPLELGSVKDCVLGQEVFAIGSPYGKLNFNSVTLGIISGVDQNYDELNGGPYGEVEDYRWSVAFSTDAAAHPGNSGCPVLTMDGKVRGVLVGGISNVLVVVMPVDLVLEDIEEVTSMFVQDKYQIEKIPDRRVDEMYSWYQWEKNDKRLDEVYYWYLDIESVIEDLQRMADVVRRYVNLIALHMDQPIEINCVD